jgi:hypothetical protein
MRLPIKKKVADLITLFSNDWTKISGEMEIEKELVDVLCYFLNTNIWGGLNDMKVGEIIFLHENCPI